MFKEDCFKEGAELSTTLEEIDGVVSTRSFEMLVQWVYHNRIVFGNSPPAEAITASIEFARFADMCRITGLENLMAEHIKQIILSNNSTEKSVFTTPVDGHTYHLTVKHINSGVLLPEGHSVRKILASSAVKGYLLRNHGKFFKDIQGLPYFAVDLLREVKVALDSLEAEKRGMTFEDPFSGQRINLNGGN
jgi:hypothetical protein